jgi:hypothetical protein
MKTIEIVKGFKRCEYVVTIDGRPCHHSSKKGCEAFAAQQRAAERHRLNVLDDRRLAAAVISGMQ